MISRGTRIANANRRRSVLRRVHEHKQGNGDKLTRWRARYVDDGTPIEAKMVAQITATLDANTHRFAWQRGGVMVADNVLSTHGRKPFSGECRILVAMAGVGGVGA